MIRCILLCFAMLLSLGASAQLDDQTIHEIKDSLTKKKTPFFESISVGVDAVGPAMQLLSSKGDYQGYVQLNIKGKYLPVAEVGYGSADINDKNTNESYKSKGMFGRVGLDFNLLRNKHDNYRLMVGLRYGFTSFNYDTTLAPDSMKVTRTVSEKCTLHWAELAFSVDAKIWGPLHMGWSFRYRRRLKASYEYDPQYGADYHSDARYAPGFGNAKNGTELMMLYTISVQI